MAQKDKTTLTSEAGNVTDTASNSSNYGTTTTGAITGNTHINIFTLVKNWMLDFIDSTLNLTDDVISQADAEAGTSTTPKIFTAQRVSQAITALAVNSASAPTVSSGTAVALDLTGGRTYGSPASPLSALTINEAGKVANGWATAWISLASDPLASVMGVGNIKNYGYEFSVSTLMRVDIACEAGGTIISVASAVENVNQSPTATNVAIGGGTAEGNQLALTYTFSDANGDSEDTTASGTQYDLRRYTSAALGDADTDGTGGTSIVSGGTLGATVNYTLAAADVGNFLVLWITPKALTGTIQGIPYRSTTSAEITATVAFVPSDLANAFLSLYPAITTSPSASIINTDDIAIWGDRSSGLLAEGPSSLEPKLVTSSVNSLETADYQTGSRFQVAANAAHNISGNNFFSYIILNIDSFNASPMMVYEKGNAFGSYALALWNTGQVRHHFGPDESSNRIISTATPLSALAGSGTTFCLKTKMVAGATEMWLNIGDGNGFVSIGTATGFTVSASTDILYLDRSQRYRGEYQTLVLGTTLTSAEETSMDAWSENLCGT